MEALYDELKSILEQKQVLETALIKLRGYVHGLSLLKEPVDTRDHSGMKSELERRIKAISQDCHTMASQIWQQSGVDISRCKMFVDLLLEKEYQTMTGYRSCHTLSFCWDEMKFAIYRFSYDDGDFEYYNSFDEMYDENVLGCENEWRV